MEFFSVIINDNTNLKPQHEEKMKKIKIIK